MTPVHKLFVIWRRPSHRRYVVGTLARESGEFVFRYKSDLRDAERDGFRELIGFPRKKAEEFRSSYLFSTFSQRLPSPDRTDFASMLASWGISEQTDDQLAILAHSGGFRVSDPIELAEYRDPLRDRLQVPLELRVAGQKYYEDPECEEAAAGDPVSFEREPTNEHDPRAVTIHLISPTRMLGYVPTQYAQLFDRLVLEGRHVIGTIARPHLVRREGTRWVVQARAEG